MRRFDRWSRSYERDRRSRFNAGTQREALSDLVLQPDDRFLDVGCGTGAAVREAAAVVSRAVGVDLSPSMISRAQNLAKGLSRVEFVVADSEDGTSDRLPARLADVVLRRLDHSHIRLHRAAEIVALVTGAGFADVSSKSLWDGGYAIVTGRKAD